MGVQNNNLVFNYTKLSINVEYIRHIFVINFLKNISVQSIFLECN